MVTSIDRNVVKRVFSPVMPKVPLREDGSVAELDVDQFSGQPFMQNVNGFVTNDIMMFEECQSDSVARAVLQRLKVIHPQSIDQNMTLDQMMACGIPANYGSPAEFVSSQKIVASKMYKLKAEQDQYYAEMAAKQAAEAAAAEAAAAEAAALKKGSSKTATVEPEV